MGKWWHDLWNSPLHENPWSVALMITLVVGFGIGYYLLKR